MTDLKPCPFCGSHCGAVVNISDWWRVVCQVRHVGCGAGGPSAATEEEAMRLWNEREATQGSQ